MTDGTTTVVEPLTRTLPNPPSYLQPVPEPSIKRGDDTFKVALTYRQKLRKANTIIKSSRGWYINVKKNYGTSPKRRWYQ